MFNMEKTEQHCTLKSIHIRLFHSGDCHFEHMTKDYGYSHCLLSSRSKQQDHEPRGDGGQRVLLFN